MRISDLSSDVCSSDLINSIIPEFSHGNRHNHEPRRPRKLLLNGREINKVHAGVMRQGMTLVPLSVYFNSRGRAKVELALAKGKKAHDKRESIQERDGKRTKARRVKARGWRGESRRQRRDGK